MLTVTRALIPAAGRGTRLSPLSRFLPKELLPVGARPNMQLVIEEAVASGITEIAIITRDGKQALERYFSTEGLHSPPKTEEEAALAALLSRMSLTVLVQQEPLGLGDALTVARDWIAGEPFAVLLPDNLFQDPPGVEHIPVLRRMLDAHARVGGAMLGCRLDPHDPNRPPAVNEAPFAYTPLAGPVVHFTSLREKGAPPFPQEQTPLGEVRGVGRGIFPASYLDAIEALRGKIAGELDDIRPLIAWHGLGNPVHGYLIEGRHFDVGDYPGYVEAQRNYTARSYDFTR